MSVFGPNQVEELIIGDAVSSQATIADFIASATDKEIKVLSANGGALAAGEVFKILQKTSGDSAKGLDYEFSDVVDPSKVNKVIVKEHNAEVQKSVTITGFDANVVADTTYAVEIRLYNDGGTLSPENFAIISGYYVTKSNIGATTAADIRDGIVTSLNNNLKRRGNSEFVITTPDTSETDIVITGKFQNVVPGKIIGRQIDFDVNAKVFANVTLTHENLGLLTVTELQKNNPGTGTGKYAVNLEWFTKGYKYEAYRQSGYPADFSERTPYYASANGTYNTIHIKYYSDRQSPTVEKQQKVLTILVDATSVAPVNAVLADLRTVLGAANVPADLV